MTHSFEDQMSALLKEADDLLAALNAELAADLDDQRRKRLESTQASLQQSREAFKAAAQQEETVSPGTDRGLASGYHEAIDALIKALKETSLLFS